METIRVVGETISSQKKGGKPNSLPPLATVRARLGSLRRTVRLDQPRVLTTGGGALPFPTGALPTHPLTPMARTIEQTAIRNFLMGPPFEQLARDVSTTGKFPCGCISATYSQLRRYLWVLFGIFAWKCGERDLPQAPSYTQPPTSRAIERLRHKLVSLGSQIGVGNWPRLAVVRGLEVIGPQRLFEC